MSLMPDWTPRQLEAEAAHPTPARGRWKLKASWLEVETLHPASARAGWKRKAAGAMKPVYDDFDGYADEDGIDDIDDIDDIVSNHGMGLHACYCCYCCTYVCMYVVAADVGASVFRIRQDMKP